MPPVHDEPRPAGAEPLHAGIVELGLERVERSPKAVVDRIRERAGRVAATAGRHDLPEQRVVGVAAAVVADRGADILRQAIQLLDELLDRGPVEIRALDGLVDVVDVGLVMLVVVDPHGLLVDRRRERVVVVGQGRQVVGHRLSFDSGSPTKICSAPHPASQ